MKKEQESKFVKYFLSNLKDIHFEYGELHIFERPDFLYKISKKTIGIEVTRVFQTHKIGEKSLQAIENERQIIVEQAQRTFDEIEGSPKLDIAVHFGYYTDVNKKNRSILANKLVDLILKNIPSINSSIIIENKFENIEDFPEEINSIRIANFSFLNRNNWHVPGFGFIQSNCIKEIQDILNKKNGYLSVYKENCGYCWLLIVADSLFPSSAFEPSLQTKENIYNSDFDRAFFMWDWFGKYFEIQLKKK